MSSVLRTHWDVGPVALPRYNGYSAVEIVGNPAPGDSTGQAMQALQHIVDTALPPGFAADWTGQSYQEILAGNSATLLMILSIVVVFLCLAALYESCFLYTSDAADDGEDVDLRGLWVNKQ
ncbi:efflux RND transporter permease subunit [Escherichia coli]|nr:efflux RND transporter permease subunit [Escherichia coli]